MSSRAWAATPDAGETRDAGPALSDSPMFVAQVGGIVGPGLGASLALDARVVGGLHMGLQGGLFTDERHGYPFVGARASYRVSLTHWLKIVPTFGVVHIRVLAQDTDPFRIAHQSPISPTAGLQVVAQFDHLITGIDAQIMPVHTTKISSDAVGSQTSEETLFPTPVSLFVGANF